MSMLNLPWSTAAASWDGQIWTGTSLSSEYISPQQQKHSSARFRSGHHIDRGDHCSMASRYSKSKRRSWLQLVLYVRAIKGVRWRLYNKSQALRDCNLEHHGDVIVSGRIPNTRLSGVRCYCTSPYLQYWISIRQRPWAFREVLRSLSRSRYTRLPTKATIIRWSWVFMNSSSH